MRTFAVVLLLLAAFVVSLKVLRPSDETDGPDDATRARGGAILDGALEGARDAALRGAHREAAGFAAAADDGPPLAAPCRVEVRLEDGRPHVGVEVTARRPDGTVVARATTGADGRCELAPPPRTTDVVTAVAAEFAFVTVLAEEAVAAPLRLGAGFVVAGRVVEESAVVEARSPDGSLTLRDEVRPVPGAVVAWVIPGVFDLVIDEVVADADGRFVMRGFPAEYRTVTRYIDVRASAEGGRLRGRATSSEPLVGKAAEFVVRMTRGVVVRGRVEDADGRAVAGAPVSIGFAGAAVVRRVGDFGTTDRAGAFELFLPVTSGRFVARAEPPSSSALDARFVRPGAGEPFEVRAGVGEADAGRVVLARAGAVVVRVHDRRGAAVPEAVVSLERGVVALSAGGGTTGDRLDPRVVEFGGLEPGPWTLRLRGRNVEPQARAVEVVEGRVTELDLVVGTGRRATGTVLDADGRPLADAPIEILAPAEPPASGWVVVRSATTGADGGFDVVALPPGPLRLRVAGAGHGTAADGVELDGEALGLRVPTTRLGRARLTLVTADGRPLPATATVTFGDPSRPDRTTTIDVTIAGGVLVLEGAAAHAGEVAIDVEGYAPFARRVVVAPGDDVDLGRVVLTTGHRVVGRVTDGKGAAVAHARVVAAGGRLETTTNGDGRYAFDGVPDGVVGVSVVAEGFEEASAKVAVHGGEARLDVVLARAAIVEGTVVAKDGGAAGGERLEFVRLDGEDGAGRGEVVALRTDDDGTFGVALPPGRYRVQAREPERTGDTLGEVEAERGVTRTLRLTLPR